jgi:hypothetical protein
VGPETTFLWDPDPLSAALCRVKIVKLPVFPAPSLFSPFGSKYSHHPCYKKTVSARSALNVTDHVSHPYNKTDNTVVLYILIFRFQMADGKAVLLQRKSVLDLMQLRTWHTVTEGHPAVVKIHRCRDSSRQSLLTVFVCYCKVLLQHVSAHLQGAITRLTGCETKSIMHITLYYFTLSMYTVEFSTFKHRTNI